MKLKVIIEPGEDSGFIAHVPALRGCWSQGDTQTQVLDNMAEAVAGWLEAQQDLAEEKLPANATIELLTL